MHVLFGTMQGKMREADAVPEEALQAAGALVKALGKSRCLRGQLMKLDFPRSCRRRFCSGQHNEVTRVPWHPCGLLLFER